MNGRSHPGRRWLLACALAVGAAFAGVQLWQLTRSGAALAAPEVVDRLFRTEFSDLQNRTETLDVHRGKVVVVNFWATWCPPCRKEMPAFSRLQEKLGGRGVQFVGIGIDSPAAIKEFALQAPVAYPLLIGGSSGQDLMRQLGNPNSALPYTLVLARDGQPVFSHLGLLTEDVLEERLQTLLAQPGR